VSSGSREQFGDLRKGTFPYPVFIALRQTLLLLCRVLLGLKVEGLERVPRKGPLLVVSNHLHNADPVILSIACPRPLHCMAKVELFRIPVIGRLIRLGGAFPVNRGKADRNAIRRAVAALDQGIAVGMFPEGTRSRSWHMEPALSGAGLVALMGKATIQPVAITGSELLPLNGVKGRRRRERAKPWNIRPGIHMIFGEPFELPATTESGTRMTAEAATELMMRTIAALLPKEYRGVYGQPGDTHKGNP
jgi:1-acyl-sn-glycerol-3-phosphate acyltransferase